MSGKRVERTAAGCEGRFQPAAMVMVILAILFAATMVNANTGEEREAEAVESQTPGAPWGINVLGIRRTAAGYMLEFRYRVVDSEKAAYLMNRKIKPELIIEETGQTLRVPVSSKLGPLRQSPKFPVAERNYFMFFANPGRTVRAGDRVTVQIGEFSASNLTVE